MSDFEVLPKGSTRELIFARKFAKDMILLGQLTTLPENAMVLINNVEQCYKELLDDELEM